MSCYPSNIENKIDFVVIREDLRARCASNLGRERVDEMSFHTDYATVSHLLAMTHQMYMALSDASLSFPRGDIHDMRESISRVRIEGLFLDETELDALRHSLSYAYDLETFFLQLDEQLYPLLRTLPAFEDVEGSLHTMVRTIDNVLDKYGRLVDNASPELARIRRELNSLQGSVGRTLASILRQAKAAGFVEGDVTPTLREGRLVIPVSPAYKRKIGGIVHDESATGKTVCIEPQQVVEANNHIRELESEERRERIRILQTITEALRPQVPLILRSQEMLADVDFLRAKVSLAQALHAIYPELVDQPMLEWYQAYHPVLLLHYEPQGKKVVPLNIRLREEENRVLVISGPNAGGKSVCLKTVALLQYMLQCGLLVPCAEQSRAGLFSQLMIDIGDEQSIQDELSTYSSHLRNMKYFVRNADARTLFLIDEMGTGTEPLIGGAIAEAVLRELVDKEALGIVTTHYTNLKHFAEQTPKVVNGAMLYDRHEMRPLFQLQIGNPGSSFAVEIARKIGLPEEVIADASQIVGSDYIQSDKYLQDIVRDKRYWEGKRKAVHQKEKELDEILGKVQEQGDELKKSRRQILKEAREEAERLLREANAKIENTIRTIVEAKAEKERTRQARQELSDFSKQLEELAKQKLQMQTDREMAKILARQERKKNGKQQKGGNAPAVAENMPQQPERKQPKIEVGMYVRIAGQQAIGEVMSLAKNSAIVRFGAIKSTVAISRLQPSEAPKEEVRKVSFLSSETQEQLHNKRLNFKEDMDIRGMRGEEAVQTVGYFPVSYTHLTLPTILLV